MQADAQPQPGGDQSRGSTNPPGIPDHELIRRIGSGSYGDVWLARNVLGQFRAVKIVHRATFEDDRPFEREFEGIRRFEPISRSHPSQLNILHVGRGEGCFYYVMELADDAGPVSEKVSEPVSERAPRSHSHSPAHPLTRSPDGYTPLTLKLDLKHRSRLPPAECVEIGLALTTALAHLHAHGLVHRDIKPSNIIFVNGVAKLADIGLVTDVDASRSFVGTEGFLPPEGPGTPQADLYSLGKVLYEMSTGRDRKDYPALPQNWDALDPAEQARLLELNEVLVKVCEADPRRRYQTAEKLREELTLLEGGHSIKSKRLRERRWASARRMSIAATAVAGIVLVGWLLATRFKPASAPPTSRVPPVGATESNSIAVLPFLNPGSWEPHEYLCSALTEEIRNALTNCAGLRVASRNAVMALKGRTNEFAEAGRQLGVRTVLATTFLRRSNLTELTARLVNAEDGAESWSRTLTGMKAEFGALGADLARQVAQALQLQLPDPTKGVVETNLQRKLQAYEFLSKAWLRQSWTKSNFTETVNLLQQALALDFDCAPAHLGLGQAYKRFSGWHLAPREAMPTARSHLLRVLELDPTFVRARSMLGVIRLHFDYDWRGAEKELRAAVKSEPSPQNCSGLLCYLWVKGEWEEGNSVAEENRRRLPDAEWTASELAGTYYYQRRYHLVAEQAGWILGRYTNSMGGHLWASRAHMGRGEFPEALAALAKVQAVDPSPFEIATEGYLYARMGRGDDARRILLELDKLSAQRFVSKLCWAMVHAGLDDRRKAMEFIEQAVDERAYDIMHLKVDPVWDNLRGEPEFGSLLKRIGLE